MKQGTYIVVAEAGRAFSCQAGKLGRLEGSKGYYLYVGSALGAGGIRARVNHHLRITEKPHWHFDYLRPYVNPQAIWFCNSANRYEHLWSSVLANLPGALVPMAKFGATDCRCEAHLYYFTKAPDIRFFQNKLKDYTSSTLSLHEAAVEQWGGNYQLGSESGLED